VAGIIVLLRLLALGTGGTLGMIALNQGVVGPAGAAWLTFFWQLTAVLAALTMTVGNVMALLQTNLRRLLACSSIAHAGYLMMGVAAAVALAGRDVDASRSAVAAVCFYLGTYVFMNLAAFAIVALLRNSLRSEEIASYAGLIRTNPGIVVATGVVLVSLIGLPPLAGFISKFLVFSSVMEAVSLDAERPLMLVLLVVGGMNTVISLFYYLRVLKVMTFDPPPADRTVDAFPLVSIPGALVTALVVPVVSLGIFWSGLYAFARLAGAFAS
jgi:NADH-quinone oxidoreductase subunit N